VSAHPFRPPRLLRNPHLQSVLASSQLRALRPHRTRLEATAAEHVLDCGAGVRLQGYLTRQTRRPEALGVAR
jgi:uncharacterized protein